MNFPPCSLFFHNYYGRHEEWFRYFVQKVQFPFYLFYHIVGDSHYNLDDDQLLTDRLTQISSPFLKKIVIRRSPNQGKDIGGKLVLMDAFLRMQTDSESIVFLHDKKSPQSVQSQEWYDKLFRIIDASFAEKAIRLFGKNKEIGIIASSYTINNECNDASESFVSNNRLQLAQLSAAFGIDTTDHRYVAGTMFWVRASPLVDFFRKHPPLDIRKTLERGNIMDEKNGTITHAWERILSWLIFARGYTIKGL
jgi:lipopolysaccharide biosynthesis protein